MRSLIVLAGPTAAGKSDAAFELANYLGSEIISADSMQVYKFLDIGTAKPSLEMREKTVHHLIGALKPDENFTAFDFKTRAEKIVHNLHKRQKIPIIAGGAGLYIKTFIEDKNCAAQVSPEIKKQVKSELEEIGVEKMFEQLLSVDPKTAERIQPNDKQRIERALSVYRETGMRFSDFYEAEPRKAPRFDVYYFLLQWDRRELYANINHRVDWMIRAGLIEETRNVLEKGYGKTLKPLQSIGYAQIIRYIEGEIPLDQAVNEIKRETRNYAKRQLTWFRKAPNTISITVDSQTSPAEVRDSILSRLPKTLTALLAAILFTMGGPSASAKEPPQFEEGALAYRAGNYQKAANQFLYIRKSTPSALAGKRALYYLGKIYSKINQYGTATRFFVRALAKYPQIEDYIRFNLAQVYFKSGRYELALKQINTLIENFPQTILLLEAEIFRVELLRNLGQIEKAVQLLEQLENFVARKPEGEAFRAWLPEIIFKQGELYESLNNSEKAHGLYWKLYVHHAAHSATQKALLKIKRLARTRSLPLPPLTLKDHSTRISALLRGFRYRQAIEEIAQLKSKKSDAPLPAEFYFYQAAAYKGLRQRRQANEVLHEFLKYFPVHPRAPEAKYTIGSNAWNLGNHRKSVDYFQSVVSDHKNSEWAPRAHFLLGKVYEDIKKYEKAIESYQAAANQTGQDLYAEKAAWSIGWNYYTRGKFRTAFDQFQKNARKFPQGAYIEQSLFWMAKASENSGGKDAARKIYKDLFDSYPFTYYGFQAGEKLRRQGIRPASNLLVRNKKPLAASTQNPDVPETLSQGLTERERFHFQRANEMAILGFYKNATLEISQLERSIKQNHSNAMWLSVMYNRVNDHTKAFRVLTRYKNSMTKLREKELPLEFWENYFPSAYSAIIDAWAAKFQVDPHLIKSVIRQESLYDARALSRAGAMGLMQIMPKTGRKLWKQLNGNANFNKEDLFDPETNIQMGVKYLDGLRKKYGEYEPYLLICYNAGPRVLEKWLSRFKHIKDNDVFIESIPYPETRNYIKRVMRNYGMYKLLYPSGLEWRPPKRI